MWGLGRDGAAIGSEERMQRQSEMDTLVMDMMLECCMNETLQLIVL